MHFICVINLNLYANEVGVDEEKFKECFAGNGYFDNINKQKEQGGKDEISRALTFFINSKQVVNSGNNKYLPVIDDFKNIINAELGK